MSFSQLHQNYGGFPFVSPTLKLKNTGTSPSHDCQVPLSDATVPPVTDANFANGDLPSYAPWLRLSFLR